MESWKLECLANVEKMQTRECVGTAGTDGRRVGGWVAGVVKI